MWRLRGAVLRARVQRCSAHPQLPKVHGGVELEALEDDRTEHREHEERVDDVAIATLTRAEAQHEAGAQRANDAASAPRPANQSC